MLFFFFFQAEDGIRDVAVTGSSDVCSSDLFFLPNLSQLTETAGDINFRKWWGSISKNNGLQGFESGSWPASSLLVGCRISRNYAVFAGATASGKREARSESSVNTGRRPP